MAVALVFLACGLMPVHAAVDRPMGAEGRDQSAERIQALLDSFAVHGVGSNNEAFRQLQQVGEPSPAAALPLRRSYYTVLAQQAQQVGEAKTLDHATAMLQAMAEREHCAPCHLEILLLRLQQVLGKGGGQPMRELYEQLAALPTFDSHDDQLSVLLAKAAVLDAMGDSGAALEAALQAGDIAARYGKPTDKVYSLELLARINGARRDLKRALQYTDEAYALAKQIGNVYLMVAQRLNQSYYYATLKDRPRQFDALRDALRMTHSAPDMEMAKLVCLNNLANYYNGAPGGYHQAIDYALRAEQLAQQLDDQVTGAFARTNRGVAMVHLGQVEAGLALANEGVDTVRKLDLKQETGDLLEQLAIAYEAAGRPQQALSATRAQQALNLEVAQVERDRSIQELQERFAAERKVHEIEQLKLQYERDQADVAARASQLRLWAAVAVVLLLGALLLGQRVVRVRSRNASLEQANARLNEQASRDALTGVYNRRYCEQVMGLQQPSDGRSRDRRYAATVGLMLIDVDHFKQVNDTHGHAAGDEVLKAVAQRLQRRLRERDTVIRWGGEEFLLLLPGTPADALAVVAQRVLADIGSEPFDIGTCEPLAVTASAGAVAWPAYAGQHWEDALHMADLALYLSKGGGRNRCTCLAGVAPEAVSDSTRRNRVRSDLAAASHAGDVTLSTVQGTTTPDMAAAV